MNTANAQQVIDHLAEQVKEQAIQIAMLRSLTDALRKRVEDTTTAKEDSDVG